MITKIIGSGSVSVEDISFYRDNVLVILGGTIQMSGAEARRRVEGTLRRVAARVAHLICSVRFQVFPRPLDSSIIGPPEWEKIVEAIQRTVDRRATIEADFRARRMFVPPRGGILVTMGTDTLAHVALIVDLEIVRRGLDARVFFTGTHSPSDVEGSDAEVNMYRTNVVAQDQSLPPGAYVVIGKEIHSGSDVAKLYTKPGEDGSYFFSSDTPLGVFNPDGTITWDTAKLAAKAEATRQMYGELAARERSGQPPKNYGYVEHVIANRRTPISVFRAALRRVLAQQDDATEGAIIIDGRFLEWSDKDRRSHASPKFLEDFQKFLDDCQKHQVLVYTGSKTLAHVISHHRGEAEQLTAIDFVDARLKLLPRRFPYDKARTKLSWLLRYFSPEDAAYFMCQNIAGELLLPKYFEQKFAHPFPTNCPDEGNAVVFAFPGMTSQVIRDAVQSFGDRMGRRACTLYVYGFGDGNLPFGHNMIHELLREAVDHRDLPSHLAVVADRLKRDQRFEVGQGIQKLFRRRDETSLLQIVRETLLGLGIFEKRTLLLAYGIQTRALTSFIRQWNRAHPGSEIAPFTRRPESAIMLESHFRIFSEALAKRVIKDLLMYGSPLLAELGRAVDSGIEVVMRTQAVRSQANLLLYELGQMSYAVGVVDEQNSPWMWRLFLPRERES